MIKRRIRDVGLPPELSGHSLRVAGIIDLLSQGVPMEDIQHLAGQADPRTTRLYDRRRRRVRRNIVEPAFGLKCRTPLLHGPELAKLSPAAIWAW